MSVVVAAVVVHEFVLGLYRLLGLRRRRFGFRRACGVVVYHRRKLLGLPKRRFGSRMACVLVGCFLGWVGAGIVEVGFRRVMVFYRM